MARRGDKPSAKIQPLLSGLDDNAASQLTLEAKAYDGQIKHPVLYPARTLRPMYKPFGEERRMVDHAKFIMDKFMYSGTCQRVDDDPLTSSDKDKFRVLIGLRSVYDDLDERSHPFFPAELRRKFPKKKKSGGGTITIRHPMVSNNAVVPMLSETVERLAAFSAAASTKRVKTDDKTAPTAPSTSLEEMIQMLSSTAESAAASAGDTLVDLQLEPKAPEEKKSDEIIPVEGDEEEEEEEEDEESEEEEDSESEDDYTAEYRDDDEEGHDAFGEDDGDAYD